MSGYALMSDHAKEGKKPKQAPSLMQLLTWESPAKSAWLLLFFAAFTAALLPLFASTPVAGVIAFERGADCLGPGSAVSFASAAVYDWHMCLILGVILVAMIANCGIVYVHWTSPPHPKFMLLPIRWFGIRLHLVSGTTEIIAGVLCWFLDDSEAVVRVMVIASFCHCFSAFLLTPVVFGCKAITVPAYIYAICFKAVQATNVWANPDCYGRVIALIATHTIYAWFRIGWLVYKKWNLFEGNAYTVALMTSCCIVTPLLGPWVLLLFFLLMAIYWAALMLRGDKSEVYMEKRESKRNFDVAGIACPFVMREHHHQQRQVIELHQQHIIDKAASMGPKASEEDKARLIFEAIDVSANGKVEFSELFWTLMNTGVPLVDAKTIMHRVDTDGSGNLSFDQFKQGLRPVWLWAYGDLVNLAKRQQMKREKAALFKGFFDDAMKEFEMDE